MNTDYEDEILKIPKIVEKAAHVAGWELMENKETKYIFTIVVCSQCKEKATNKLSIVKEEILKEETTIKDIEYNFHIKQDKLDTHGFKLDVSNISKNLKEINKKLSEYNSIFYISDKDIYKEKRCLDIFSKSNKYYLYADHGMNISIHMKKEKTELHVETHSRERIPGQMMLMAGVISSQSFDTNTKTIIFKKILKPLECSCELVKDYKNN
jgi:hypothetical protein